MPHTLQAGPVQVRYENGFLRYISVEGTEILRMIYFAIRDQNWQTASISIINEVINEQADSFRINYTWHVNDLNIQMVGQVTIQGDSNGTISVDFRSKAENSFQKNRIGLCVLHPIDGVLGQPAEITAPDGSVTAGDFPTFISPNQPFLNVQSMRWQPASGSTWQLDFSGDVFETEDQRNWTDTSFKTYSTPLTKPFPVTVSAGDEFNQRVVFKLANEPLTDNIPVGELREEEEPIAPTAPTYPLIGVGQRTGGPRLTASEATLLRKLNLSHLRADVFFSLPNWQELLADAVSDAQSLVVPLELAVFFGNDPKAKLWSVHDFFRRHPVPIRSILLFDAETLTTSDTLLQALTPIIRTEWPTLLIGGGTDDNFAELNRHPFDFELVDFVTYSVNPQVHASDDLTLQENIAGQAETVLSARRLNGGKPVHISPITLRPRFVTRAGTATERLNIPADPRQTTEFGADWTRRSLQTLQQVGVASVTYYQSHGPGGLVDGEKAYPVFSVFE
jgi:hypothetical protein